MAPPGSSPAPRTRAPPQTADRKHSSDSVIFRSCNKAIRAYFPNFPHADRTGCLRQNCGLFRIGPIQIKRKIIRLGNEITRRNDAGQTGERPDVTRIFRKETKLWNGKNPRVCGPRDVCVCVLVQIRKGNGRLSFLVTGKVLIEVPRGSFGGPGVAIVVACDRFSLL